MSSPASKRSLWTWVLVTAAGAGLAWAASGRDWAEVSYAGASGGARSHAVVTGAELAAGLGPLAMAALASILAVLAVGGVWRRLVALVTAACGAGIALIGFSGAGARDLTDLVTERSPLASAATDWSFTTTVWPTAAAAGGLVLVAGGLTAAVLGPRWPGMSDRYSRRPRAAKGGSPVGASVGSSSGSSGGEATGSAVPSGSSVSPGPAASGASGTAPQAARRQGAGRPAERSERALWDAIDSGEDPTGTADDQDDRR
ncbi:trp region conserved hypothetical membrane protein [Sinosporangium album]|uniref:Trp region conserved hypothetical membrane protein n=1 Tax=Sinosporangium album TaxID=504805 RepID=A0A1G7X8N1_9ACTN|nr:Trp biosynthesis-associated membrane protein [Sinosporangium album]SDG80579.1 trp region conserved hypothetical membrane protein [Sinosporangium album]